MKIIISDNIKFYIDNIYSYLSNISSSYANKTIKNIYNTIYSIEYAPYIGRYVPECDYNYFRERICKKYRIVYYVLEKNNEIHIQYIFSGKQNSKLFFKVRKNELSKILNQNIFYSF